MRCEDAIEELRSVVGPARGAVLQHVAECESCRAAANAITALVAERVVPAPRLTEGAFERALRRAVQPPQRSVPNRRGFWLGTAVGGALAAGLAVAITVWWLQPTTPRAAANPQVRLALHEVRPVNVSLDSPESLKGAEIHIVLTGAIGLEGYAEQRELRWVTDLDAGVNQLTLPLVALGPSGGQVMVEVQHGDKRRAFVVDVQTGDTSARQPTAARAQAARPVAV